MPAPPSQQASSCLLISGPSEQQDPKKAKQAEGSDEFDEFGMEESMEKALVPEQPHVGLQPEEKDAEGEILQLNEQPGGALTVARGAIDHLQKRDSVRTESSPEVELFVMPLQASAARLEPMLADAGMPPIISASVVNASPATPPDIAFSIGRQSPARTQNAAARPSTGEKTRQKDKPGEFDSKEFELTWM
jgi:hypothetical protein